MNCPWCGFTGVPRALHAHLDEAHPERVRVGSRGDARYYSVTCPVCDAAYEQVVKPRLRDPGFVDEFGQQIRLVAFDMLVNHLIAEHEERATP